MPIPLVLASTSWTQIKVLSISDIHLGNAANPAEYVIAGLEKKLSHKALKGLNLLFIVGDVFDRGLTVNHRDVPHIVSWIRRLLARCARLGIIVIVIEGTPSHDRLQSQLFVAINDAADEDDRCNLRYIKEISIERIEEYGLDILCIPDEKNTSDEITYNQVIAMMKARAIEKVDFALIHGFFDFQVPVGRHSRFHDSEKYRKLIRYLAFVGHDHEFQKNGEIIIQGSPDRQRHGMESPKGFVKAIVHRDGHHEATFEVNEHAMVFKTILLSGDLDNDSALVHDTCSSVNRRSHIRLSGYSDNPLLQSLDTLQSMYPFINFSKKKLDEEVEDKTSPLLDIGSDSDSRPFTIDSSNLKQIVFERLGIILQTDDEARYFDSLMESVT